MNLRLLTLTSRHIQKIYQNDHISNSKAKTKIPKAVNKIDKRGFYQILKSVSKFTIKKMQMQTMETEQVSTN